MELYERLMGMVKVNESKSWNGMACLEWQRFCKKTGYGQITTGSRAQGNMQTHVAHRLYWTCFRGPIPDGVNVCHRCDNRKCCNPAHLFLGTQLDNVQDMMKKGRKVSCPGHRNGRAKLCEADIPVIRNRVAAGETLLVISKDYGVSQVLISLIGRRKSWSHVESELQVA